jgi:hypothetical protein
MNRSVIIMGVVIMGIIGFISGIVGVGYLLFSMLMKIF